nr:MAG TPA: Preprotein translocase subunit SecB [Caudoviricetes sp.]
MLIKTKYESFLSLKKIEIVESSFRKKDTPLHELELGIQVKHSINKLNETDYEIFLSATVADEDEKLYVYVKGRAIFHIENCEKILLEKNTLAIMFPYIRSYVSTITTQPGISPIVLPPMNIAAMIDDQNEHD